MSELTVFEGEIELERKENFIPNSEIVDFLDPKIDDLEDDIGGLALVYIQEAGAGRFGLLNTITGIQDTLKTSLAKIYLEKAFLTLGVESLMYVHKAVRTNPNVQVQKKMWVEYGTVGFRGQDEQGGVVGVMKRGYTAERSAGHMSALESFLEDVKEDVRQGKSSVDFYEAQHEMIQNGRMKDPHIERSHLAQMTDEEFGAEKRRAARENQLDVGGFLSGMLISAEKNRREKVRWEEGTQLPQVSPSDLDKIFSTDYPQHVMIDSEALGGISLGRSKRFGAIDDVCDEICVALAQRLSRRVNAYKFTQGYAQETVAVEGIGEIEVRLSTTGGNIFTYITAIESEDFRIWNCRQTGRMYLDRFNDIGLPSEIKIKPEEIEIHLYKDGSGDNPGGVQTDRISGWLRENILEKILATPEYENQAIAPPIPASYPEQLGPLYTWIHVNKAEKLQITQGNDSKVYPDERSAMEPSKRLISLGGRGDYPAEANDGYIWCGIGTPEPNSTADEYQIPGHWMDSTCGNYTNLLVRVDPLHADDMYVVDYKVWDDVREEAFKHTDRLTDKQVHEFNALLARTMVPVAEYEGNYGAPVVIVGRDLAFNEVEIVPGVVTE